jgi:hypothetical protein
LPVDLTTSDLEEEIFTFEQSPIFLSPWTTQFPA